MRPWRKNEKEGDGDGGGGSGGEHLSWLSGPLTNESQTLFILNVQQEKMKRKSAAFFTSRPLSVTSEQQSQ